MVVHADCLEAMEAMDPASVDCILSDPPYYRVKGEPWDRQWSRPEKFLAWLDRVSDAWKRVLAPMGTLYCFASPRMATRVDVMLADRWDVLSHIRWEKPTGRHKRQRKADMRAYWPAWEALIMAAHQHADDRLRGQVFEALREYLASGWAAAGLTVGDLDTATGTHMGGHYLTARQWQLPTKERYLVMQERAGREHLPRDWEDLHAEHQQLMEQYGRERRPFHVTEDVPYTDIWRFASPGRRRAHCCQKPLPLLKHVLQVSTRPGDVVLDTFAGSGSTGMACLELGRRFVGIEASERWCEHMADALRKINGPGPRFGGILRHDEEEN